MLEILSIGAASAVSGVVAVVGHMKSKDFVRRRLRFTAFVETPFIGIAAGVAATLLALPIVGMLPVLGIGTALAFGLGIGTGVAIGARHARERRVVD